MLKAALLTAWFGTLAFLWAIVLTAGAWLWHYLWFRNRKGEPPAEVVTRWVVIVVGAAMLVLAMRFANNLFPE